MQCNYIYTENKEYVFRCPYWSPVNQFCEKHEQTLANQGYHLRNVGVRDPGARLEFLLGSYRDKYYISDHEPIKNSKDLDRILNQVLDFGRDTIDQKSRKFLIQIAEYILDQIQSIIKLQDLYEFVKNNISEDSSSHKLNRFYWRNHRVEFKEPFYIFGSHNNFNLEVKNLIFYVFQIHFGPITNNCLNRYIDLEKMIQNYPKLLQLLHQFYPSSPKHDPKDIRYFKIKKIRKIIPGKFTLTVSTYKYLQTYLASLVYDLSSKEIKDLYKIEIPKKELESDNLSKMKPKLIEIWGAEFKILTSKHKRIKCMNKYELAEILKDDTIAKRREERLSKILNILEIYLDANTINYVIKDYVTT